MILQALHQLAEREHLLDDPDYEYKPVAWRVVLSASGELRGILSNHYEEKAVGKRKPKVLPKKELIPMQPTGRAGTKAPACFLVDNAKYVFGAPTEDKGFSVEEGAQKSGWFLDLVRSCLEATSDPAIGALVAFLEKSRADASTVALPEGCKSNDLFAFVVEPDVDVYVHARPSARSFWKEHRKTLGKKKAGGESICLVTGQQIAEASLFKLIKGVPGGSSSGVAIVAFNKPAFLSYGWEGNQNAPISQAASEACAIALNRLLDDRFPDPLQPGQSLPGRNLRLSSDTVVCYWTSKENEFCSLFGHLLSANADEVKALYHSIWRGKAPQIDDPSAFYALTLTGTQGRAIVRGWLESTVGEVAVNLAMHFADLDIVRNTHPGKDRSLPPSFSLAALAEAMAPGGDREQVPAPLITELATAAIRGTPYPLSALQRALERSRAEVGRSEWLDSNRKDARAALIKAVLNRRRRLSPDTCHYPEVKKDMDPNANSPGYSLGRLLAVLERLQALAINDANATVVDRFFGGASATPKAVFVRLLKGARHHARKAMDGENGGMAFRLDRIIDELTGPFQPKTNGFPAHLDLEQQGLFVLGYHQMRKWLWMSSEERAAWEAEHADAPKQYLWSKKA